MARKGESTNEKIVRMYKAGKSIEAIASELQMPKDNVPKILEKYMPDYANYNPAEKTEEKGDKHKKKGFGGFFKKDKSSAEQPQPKEETNGTEPEKEEPKSEPKSNSKQQNIKPTVNLAMNENGFVDSVVRGIASMLQNGKDVDSIAEFFNRSEADINAVRECMDEHFKRSESGESEEEEVPAEPTVSSSPYSLTGLEGSAVIKQPRYNAPEKREPEIMDEMPSIDPVSLDELDKQIEAMGNHKSEENENGEPVPEMESVQFNEPDEETVQAEEVQQTAEEVSDADAVNVVDDVNVVNEEETAAVEETDVQDVQNAEQEAEAANTTAEITADEETEEISFTLTEEDESMSPMEKMKMFAKQQISLNDKKIEDLKAKKDEILGSAETIDNELADNEIILSGIEDRVRENENNSAEVKEKISQLEKELEELKAKISDFENESENIAREAEEAKAKAEELKAKKENIQQEVSAVDEEIAAIEKENKEFEEYC